MLATLIQGESGQGWESGSAVEESVFILFIILFLHLLSKNSCRGQYLNS